MKCFIDRKTVGVCCNTTGILRAVIDLDTFLVIGGDSLVNVPFALLRLGVEFVSFPFNFYGLGSSRKLFFRLLGVSDRVVSFPFVFFFFVGLG